jgi:hypothetical protein
MLAFRASVVLITVESEKARCKRRLGTVEEKQLPTQCGSRETRCAKGVADVVLAVAERALTVFQASRHKMEENPTKNKQS